jgi:glycosyltransferase involved in cell wall biosynthesis
MHTAQPMFSICIPAYNRAKYLKPLLDSIYCQNFDDFEIVICEDKSTERNEIRKIVEQYMSKYPNTICYFENPVNFGYDANIRNLVEKSSGIFCFFMGNDDLLCKDALKIVANAIDRHKNIGFVLKSYAWFNDNPDEITQVIHYFKDEKIFKAGKESIRICFRRSGVISGFIVHRNIAQSVATQDYDGSLYYQMHLSGEALVKMSALYLPDVLVLCRNSEAPEFGSSESEKGKYTPGSYTPTARLNMVAGAVRIAEGLDSRHGLGVTNDILRDYANYFYPYIKDQLNLPPYEFYSLYKSFCRIGFSRFPMFHFYCFICYCLGQSKFDILISVVRKFLGRSPHFGKIGI